MREQVGNYKARLAFLITYPHLYYCAVLECHNSVKRKGHCGPLILLDAAVVMGLEHSKVIALIKGIWLEVKAG